MEEIIKPLSVAVVFVALMTGFGYWIRVMFKKKYPNFRYHLKYKIFRRPFPEGDVNKMLQYLDAKITPTDVEKLILISPKNKRTARQVREMIYIYSEMQKVERGVKT